MKKLYLFIIVLLGFLLVSCEEIVEPDKIPAPAIELKVTGETLQYYETPEDLEDVNFQVVFKNFAENEINISEVTINWYEGSNLIEASQNKTTHNLEILYTLNLTVKVEVIYNLNGRETTLSENQSIQVLELPTNISISNSVDSSTHQLSEIFSVGNEIRYTAVISGNLTHKTGKWIVVKRDDSQEEIDRFEYTFNLADELVIDENNKATLTFDYEFTNVGNYVINLEIGKYKSNYQHVSYRYGDFEITYEGSLTQLTTDVDHVFEPKSLAIGTVSEVVGEGVYKWFLNGEELNNNTLRLDHEENTLGGYLYHAEFHPDNPEFDIIKTEPVLITNALIINNLGELKNSVSEKTPAIALFDDIEVDGLLTINHSMTIIGNGYTISSAGIDVIIRVNANNVYMKDLVISDSSRYNIHYNKVKGGYLEDITFVNPGRGGGMTDLSAGAYLQESEVTMKNIDIISAPNTGVRIDSPHRLDENEEVIPVEKSVLTLLGHFNHGGAMLPVASGNSMKENVEVRAKGFVLFVLPIQSGVEGGTAIRRWSNESETISWTLNDPNKTNYSTNEAIDVFGIAIDVRFEDEFIQGDLELVYIFLKMFDQYGTIEITTLDGKTLIDKYYIIGEQSQFPNVDYVFGEDKLLYSDDSNGTNFVRPIIETPGEYLVRVTIGDELDLGTFKITVSN